MYISKSVIVAPKSSSSWNMSWSLVVINLFIFLVQVNVFKKCINLKTYYKLRLEKLHDMITTVQNVIAYYLILDKIHLILVLQPTTNFASNVNNNAHVSKLINAYQQPAKKPTTE